MALLNYMAPGLYAIVDHTLYFKESKTLRFDLMVYASAAKEVCLATRTFEMWPNQRAWGIKTITASNTPPQVPENNDSFLTGTEPTGAWADRPNMRATWDGTEWTFWFINYGQKICDESTQKFYQRSMNQVDFVLVESSGFSDIRTWDSWFSPAKVYADGANITKQIYEYLKTQPGFETCSDV